MLPAIDPAPRRRFIFVSMSSSWTESAWLHATPIIDAILAHPFLDGLSSGDLDGDAFQQYVIQDSHYLREFGRGLALLAARSPTPGALAMFCQHAAGAVAVEQALHASFFTGWNLNADSIAASEPTPTTALYTSFLLRHAYDAPYAEALAAFLPCYWIYGEVGKRLVRTGSPNELYQRWIDTYAGEEFATVVREVLTLADRIAENADEQTRTTMCVRFAEASRLEFLFWDAAYRRESWPLPIPVRHV